MDKKTFIKRVAHAEIAASAKQEIDLNDIRADLGSNLNTLIITNTDTASDIEVYLDGEKVAFVTANNGMFSFDHEFGFKFNFLSIENTNAGAAIAASKVKISAGVSGAINGNV